MDQLDPTFKELGTKLFGENNILNTTSRDNAPNPMAVFCTESSRKKFYGEKVLCLSCR